MHDLTAILLGVVMVNVLMLPAFPALASLAPGIAPGTALPRLGLLLPLVVAPSAGLAWLLGQQLLKPSRLVELQPLLLIIVTALTAQVIARLHDALAHRDEPLPRSRLTFNAVAAGLALEATLAPDGFAAAVVAGGASGAALGALELCCTGLRERLAATDLPRAWRGAGIMLVTAGILALGLGGFAGLRGG